MFTFSTLKRHLTLVWYRLLVGCSPFTEIIDWANMNLACYNNLTYWYFSCVIVLLTTPNHWGMMHRSITQVGVY